MYSSVMLQQCRVYNTCDTSHLPVDLLSHFSLSGTTSKDSELETVAEDWHGRSSGAVWGTAGTAAADPKAVVGDGVGLWN